jgi:hypothetical protein
MTRTLKTTLTLLAVSALIATPALAHQGDHTGLTFSAFLDHLLEWDHLAMMAGAAALAVAGFRWFKARRGNTDRVR